MESLENLVNPLAISEQYVRARGPGGQHVNTSSTAVQLRLDLARSGLAPRVLERLRELAGQRLTREDEIILIGDQHRSLQRNRDAVRQRLTALLLEARKQPRKRVPTRPGRAARERRLEGKKGQGRKKRLRKPPDSGM